MKLVLMSPSAAAAWSRAGAFGADWRFSTVTVGARSGRGEPGSSRTLVPE
ncbi:hypothetical protein [Methylobacterium komagatae]